MTEPERFPFRFAAAYRVAARPFGITPDNSEVRLWDDRVEARFGPWRLLTPYSNIVAVEVTGPYRFVKTAGPARLGITDRGLTFASNGDGGVLLSFRDKVPGMEPTGLLRHPELTVTVADLPTFAAHVADRAGIRAKVANHAVAERVD